MALRDLFDAVLSWRMAPTEVAGSLLSVAAVWLTIRRSVWSWPVWMAATLLYLWVFAEAKLYSDAGLQVFFLITQAIGWRRWGREDPEGPTTRLAVRERALWLLATVGAAALWGAGMDRFTDAAMPYPDAFVAMGSVASQWLQTRKRIESWIGWILVDGVATVVYAAKGLHPTAELYVGFTVLAAIGWRDWARALPPAGGKGAATGSPGAPAV